LNRFASLKDLDAAADDDVDISKALGSIRIWKLQPHVVWVIIRWNGINHGLMKNSKLLDQRKPAELQWWQNPSQTNGDNLNSVRCETSRTSWRKVREYLKWKINELETKRTKMNLRKITNLELTAKGENCKQLAHFYSILNRCKNYFCQLLRHRCIQLII
jgi:hypothetical protein